MTGTERLGFQQSRMPTVKVSNEKQEEYADSIGLLLTISRAKVFKDLAIPDVYRCDEFPQQAQRYVCVCVCESDAVREGDAQVRQGGCIVIPYSPSFHSREVFSRRGSKGKVSRRRRKHLRC